MTFQVVTGRRELSWHLIVCLVNMLALKAWFGMGFTQNERDEDTYQKRDCVCWAIRFASYRILIPKHLPNKN